MSSRRWVNTLAPFLLPLAACSSDEPAAGAPTTEPPPDEIRYETFPWTKELSAETLSAVVAVSEDDGSIRFRGTPSQLAGLAAGNVLVAGAGPTAPRGLLRQVVEVKSEGGDTVIVTQPVAVQLAFKSLHARITAKRVALDGSPAGAEVRPQSKYSVSAGVGGGRAIDWRVFDQDKNPETKDDQLYVRGEVKGELTITAYIDLDWLDDAGKAAEELACALAFPGCTPELPDVKVGARADAVAAIGIDAEGAAATKFVSDELPIDGTAFDLPPLSAGPVVVYPTVDFVAQIGGSATSRFHAKAGLKYAAMTEVSLGLKSGPSFVPPTFTHEVNPGSAEAALSAEVKASVGPRIRLLFWDTFGPSFTISGYGKMRVNAEQAPCWALDVGAEAKASVSLRVPWKLFGLQKLGKVLGLAGNVANKSFGPWNLFEAPNHLTGACGTLPGSVYPPGDGPTDEAYKAPTFAPWSRRIDVPGVTFPFSGQISSTAIHTDRAIDGAWLVSGIGIPGVLKIAEDGRVVWSKSTLLPRVTPPEPDDAVDGHHSAFAAQALDTNIWIAASRFTIMKVDQDGDAVWSRRYVPKDASLATALEATGLVPLDDGGALVLYAVKDTPKDGPAVLLRIDAAGDLLFAKTFTYGNAKTFAPSFTAAGDGDVFVSGYSWEPGSAVAHVARLKADGSVAFARKLDVCGSNRVRPGPSIRLASGALAIAGTYSLAPERSMIVQIAPDGSAGSAGTWWTGDALKDAQTNAIAQLPISGFMSLGIGVPMVGESLLLSSHDAQGTLTWQRELTLEEGGTRWGLRPGALRLTNDGGALVIAYAVDNSISKRGLWVSKLPARTGDGAFDPAYVKSAAGTLVQEACSFVLTPDTLALADLPLEAIDASAATPWKDEPTTVTKLIP